jgi:hypothetical protein
MTERGHGHSHQNNQETAINPICKGDPAVAPPPDREQQQQLGGRSHAVEEANEVRLLE